MCVNYKAPEPQHMRAYWRADPPFGASWKAEVWQHYDAPFIVGQDGERQTLIGGYGLVPKDKCPPGVRLSTMNARAETIGTLRSYKRPWAKSQLCLVPMMAFYEQNYEGGKPVRWEIKLADDQPFAVAGIWERWDADTDTPRHTFTQITINADEHPIMSRFHRPGDEKRSLVVIRPEDYDEWLSCRNPGTARSFLQHYPAELLVGMPAPTRPRKRTEDTEHGRLV